MSDESQSATQGAVTGSGRPVFVGDIQGCADEFDALLARVRDRLGEDCFVHVVGDLVNRGPDNLRVLARMRELEASGRGRCVLGNHELHCVMVALDLRRPGGRDSITDVLGSAERDDWVHWLRTRPLVSLGEIGASPFVVVHAAVHPAWDRATVAREAAVVEASLGHADLDVARTLLAESLDDARPGSPRDVLGRLTSCRSTHADRWSSRLPEGQSVPWHETWSRHGHDYGVVYGHWALQGLHVAPGLRGLDTGCVHHGRGRDGLLTAWLPTPSRDENRGAFAVPDERFLQVRALRPYYRP